MKDGNPFRQKLYHHTMPVGDDLWARIESQLPAPGAKKKFPFFLFSMTAIVTLAGGILFWLSLQDSLQSPNKIPGDTPDNMETPATNPAEQTDLSSATNNTLLNTEKALTHNNLTTLVSSSSSAKIDNASSTSPSISIQKGKNINIRKELKTSQENNPTAIAEPVHITAPSEAIFSKPTTPFVSTENFTHRTIERSAATSSLPLAEIEYVSEDELSEGIINLKPDPSCYKFSGGVGKSRISFDLFAAPGFSPRTFTDTGGESAVYALARRATEQNKYSFSGGARINYNINHEFSVRAGLLYEQLGDLFDYIDTLATKRTTRIDSFFSADGTFLYTETKTELILGTQIKKIHNRYHHLDIPLLFSYELPMGRATLMANAGPVLNLTTSYRGQILDAGLIPQHITPGERDQLQAYKTNIGLSIYLGAGALFPLTDHIAALIEPRLLFRIKPVTLDTYPLKEHRHFAGLNLGIRYHFN